MKADKIEKNIELPEGITAEVAGRKITLKGEKGSIDRIWNNPKITIKQDGNKLLIVAEKPTNREKKDINTLCAHINNNIRGVTEGHPYRLKVCSGHFPMNVSLSNNIISVKNYLGEKIPRVYTIKPGVDIKIEGDIININSIDIEAAGDCAASIERMMKITNRDRRIFQDGIYMTMKDGKELK